MGKKKANKGESEVLDTKPAPRGLTLASFLAFPSLGEAPTPNASAPSYCAADPLAIPSSSASCEVASEQHDGLGPKVLAQAPASTWQPKCSGITAKTAATSQTSKTVSISQATKDACPYTVHGSKKGGFPLQVESRAGNKKVTLIRKVTGDVDALLKDLKHAVGTGGVLRGDDVEIQGDHMKRVETLLVKKGCIKGISHVNITNAEPKIRPKSAKAEKTIARLDKKAEMLKQKQ